MWLDILTPTFHMASQHTQPFLSKYISQALIVHYCNVSLITLELNYFSLCDLLTLILSFAHSVSPPGPRIFSDRPCGPGSFSSMWSLLQWRDTIVCYLAKLSSVPPSQTGSASAKILSRVGQGPVWWEGSHLVLDPKSPSTTSEF